MTTRRGAPLFAFAAIASSIAAWSPAASAAPEEDDKLEARELVYRGDELFAQKRVGEALEAYREAHEIMRVPTTGIEVAKTLAAMGRLMDARSAAADVEALPKEPDEPIPFWEARQRASQLIRELDRRIPTVSLDIVPGVKKRTIRIDKERVPDELAWLPLRMDPGRHVISVSAPGFASMEKPVEVKEGQRIKLQLVLLEKSDTPSPLAITGFVVSGAALTTAIVTGSLYLAEQDDLEAACARGRRGCDEAAWDRANALGWTANVSLVVAVAGGVIGGVAYVLDRDEDTQNRVTAVVSPGYVGIRTDF